MKQANLLLVLLLLFLFSNGQTNPIDSSSLKYEALTNPVPGYYTVNASKDRKVYFYTTPDTSTKRKAFFSAKDWAFVQKIKSGFGYVLFFNSNGQKSEGWLEMQYLTKDTSSVTTTVSRSIEGYFTEKKKKIFAFAVQTKQGKGNPVEDGIPDEYTVFFSDNNIKPIKIGCCDAMLVNEGDLNNDGQDDFSVYQAPENGCTYHMYTYSYQNGDWKKIVPLFLVATGCDELTDAAIQKMVFKQKDGIYFYDIGPDVSLVKKKVIPQ